MAYELLFPSSGAMDFADVSEKLQTASDMRSMSARIGQTVPDVFPDDFYGVKYLGFVSAGITRPATAGSFIIAFTAYGAWTITDNAAWLTVNTTSGTGAGAVSINATLTANTGTARIGVITLTRGSYSVTFNVTQAAGSTTSSALTFSNVSYGSAFAACDATGGSTVTRYVSGSKTVPINGDILYTNSNLTTVFNGNNLFYKQFLPNYSMRISATGVVSNVLVCPS